MKPVNIVVVFACTIVLAVAFRFASSQQPTSELKLPGARAEIDAGKFASLQAAIDALPANGGVVRLPAGVFEITQPLLIKQEDVLLQGAGTATHIRNTNTTR